MEEGPNKRRLLYNLQQEKLSSTALTEERVLHEAYQFLGENLNHILSFYFQLLDLLQSYLL